MEYTIYLFAFIFSIASHYFTNRIFITKKIFDKIEGRSSHIVNATRTGGIGLFITIFIISIFCYFLKIELYEYSLLIPLGIIFITGFYDDLYNADYKLKFFLQIIVAKIIIDQGYLISNLDGIFGIYELSRFSSQIITIFFYLVIVNSFNFIDGIDGLSITETIKTLIFFISFTTINPRIFPLGLIIISTLIPLYYFNFKANNKVFLGDSGSLVLGTLIAIFVLDYISSDLSIQPLSFKYLFVFILLNYPLIDFTRVFLIRVFNKRSPFIADKNHLHHLILKKVKTQKLTLIIIQLISTLIIVIYLLSTTY